MVALKRFGGLMALTCILLAAGVLYYGNRWAREQAQSQPQAETPPQPITVVGAYGSEKQNLLENEQVIQWLQTEHGITLDVVQEGSMEMVKKSVEGRNILWPAGQTAFDFYTEQGGTYEEVSNVFYSPLVIYSWAPVVDSLVQQGIVEQVNGQYVIDLQKLLELSDRGVTWADIGLPELYGQVGIISTDPTASNSGAMFAILLANTYDGDIIDASTLETVGPKVKDYFARQGRMERSTGILFEKFRVQGMGSYPLIVGYEHELIEFFIALSQDPAQASTVDRLYQEVRVLYPKTTLWSDHPLLALDPNGEQLLKAVMSPEFQQMAWADHGFRSGLVGGETNRVTDELKQIGIVDEITAVDRLPTTDVMLKLDEVLTSP